MSKFDDIESSENISNSDENDLPKVRLEEYESLKNYNGYKINIEKKPKRYFKDIFKFITFQIIFGLISLPLIVFYGPFDNVKSSVVGTLMNSMNRFKQQSIVRLYLSNDAIERILNDISAKVPVENEEEVLELTNKEVRVIESHSNKMEILNIKGDKFDGKMIIVYDPLRIVAGSSSKIPLSGETTSAIAKKNDALAAINAGGFMDARWAGTGGAPMGYLIHNGKVIYNEDKSENVKRDTVAFTDEGKLIVGNHTISQLKKYKVKEGVSFGPALVVNGKPTIKKGDGGWGIAPRTAIAQRADGAVLLLVVDGRSLNSYGATLRDVQDIFLQYKAYNAANLDGGSSTTMYYNGRVINTPSDALGERAVPTVFMVAKNIP